MHSDQTGRFPATSSRGNQYVMVLVEVDGNYIDAKPLKNKSEGAMIQAYLTLWKEINCIRHSQTNNSHPGQQSICGFQNGNQKELHNSISPT
jgi:hypothetical protein